MGLFGGVKTKDINHQEVIEKLVRDSSPRKTFLIMIVISSFIGALGLLNDSASIVIGAMLVAPLLWPVLGISMGILVRDWRMIKLAMISIGLSVILSVVVAIAVTSTYVPIGASHEILIQTSLSFMAPIAIAAGVAAAMAISFESIKEAVSGIAISVALIPPIVTVGIGLGGSDWDLMRRAAELFGINLLAIIVTSYLVFSVLGFKNYKRVVDAAVKREERVLKSKK
jgi:uncharacterized hydrophobic protein (TIGR00271 family)